MRAIVITSYGGPEVLAITEYADPEPTGDEVLIRVRAFGINHAEAYMRSGAWGDVAAIPGIECAGVVERDPTGTLDPGTRVVAILGGMGRSRNGSYAELVSVPASNVAAVTTSLSWTDLVAIPEVYATAWAGLHQNLAVQPGETVLVRGATSSLGQAAVNIAVDAGATVIATSRNSANAARLLELGVSQVLVEDGKLVEQTAGARLRVDAVFDVVGNRVLRDSLTLVRPRGRVCQLGFLGGLGPVADFDPISDLPTGVQLSFYGSAFVLGSADFPLADIPLAEVIAKAEAGTYQATPARVFDFDQIVEAHRLMESGRAGGRMVVSVGSSDSA
jgi:NADPH:quinone reductase-like Zn-dependent oxidoreductase